MYTYCPYCGHKLVEKEENGFHCKNCGRSIYVNPKPGVIIIPVVNDEIAVAVRAREPMKGQIDFLGGYLEMGETPEEGAIRELKEETQLELSPDRLELIGIWKDEYEVDGIPEHTLNISYVIRFDQKPEFISSDDVAEIKWVSIKETPNFAFEFQVKVINKLQELLCT